MSGKHLPQEPLTVEGVEKSGSLSFGKLCEMCIS